MKRIIFTVTNDLTYDQRMQKICRSLAAAGYDVELVGRKRSFSAPFNKEPFRQTRLNCFFTKGKFFYLEYNLRLFWYLLFQKFDAVCAIDLDTIVPVYAAGSLKNAKLIYDAHEYFTEVPEVMNRKGIKKAWQWVEKTFVHRFHLHYTVSQGIADLFHRQYGVPFHLILNVPHLKETEQPKTKTERTILYQGALNAGRGLEFLLEAMQQIDAKLLIAGEGDLSDTLRKMATDFSLSSKVTFLGYVQPAELAAITQNAYIGIHVSEDKGLSYYYSLGNKFFNYIHARIPQVCTSFPEYERINSECEVAVMIKSGSADEIKQGIQRLLTDKALYERLQKNCDVCARHYNWQNEEKKLVALYNELLR